MFNFLGDSFANVHKLSWVMPHLSSKALVAKFCEVVYIETNVVSYYRSF